MRSRSRTRRTRPQHGIPGDPPAPHDLRCVDGPEIALPERLRCAISPLKAPSNHPNFHPLFRIGRRGVLLGAAGSPNTNLRSTYSHPCRRADPCFFPGRLSSCRDAIIFSPGAQGSREAIGMDDGIGSRGEPYVWHKGPQHELDDESTTWRVDSPVIGPARSLGPGKRSSKDVQRQMDLAVSKLAPQLCWAVSRRRTAARGRWAARASAPRSTPAPPCGHAQP